VEHSETTGKGGEVDLLLRIISDSRAGWETVATCGRAIAATGRLNVWALSAGKNERDAESLADVLLAFGDASERIEAIWASFLESGDEETFQVQFSRLVTAMESANP
jgi:hypothetical protein